MATPQQISQHKVSWTKISITLSVVILLGCWQKVVAQQRNGDETNETTSSSSTRNGTVNFNIIQLMNGEYLEMFGSGTSRGILRGHPSTPAIELGSLSADPLIFSTNSIERMRILPNGFVGIGTNNPINPFELHFADTNPYSPIGASPARIRLVNTNATNNNVFEINLASSNSDGGILTGVRLAGIFKNHIPQTASADFAIVLRNNGAYSEVAHFTSTGNVGFGTMTPTHKLDVAGSIRSSSGGFVFPDGTVQISAAPGGGSITAVNAGSGLTGGGTSGSLTLNVGEGTGLTVAADSVSVNYGSTAGTAVQGNTSITVAAGTGLSGGGSLTLGAGGSVTLTNSDRGSSQSVFKNVANASGVTQFAAGSNNDSIRFQGSGGINVSFDAATKKIVIDGSTSTSSMTAANISAGQFGLNTGGGNYTFPNDVTVNGNIAAKYQDVAEWVESSQQLPAGAVVVLDPRKPNQVIASTQSYDSRVAGVISLRPGLTLGEAGEGRVLVATTGRVKVKVDATNGPIQIGDLLVTSAREGFAMKSSPVEVGGIRIHRPGTLIGKALEPLTKGTGEILVLLSLQ